MPVALLLPVLAAGIAVMSADTVERAVAVVLEQVAEPVLAAVLEPVVELVPAVAAVLLELCIMPASLLAVC